MSFFVGAFLVSGSAVDTVSNLEIEALTNEGLPWQSDVGTGYTVSVEIHKAGDADVFATMSGDWEDIGDVLNPNTLFPIPSDSSLIPSTIGDEVEYECYLLLTKTPIVVRKGADSAGTPFGFTVKRVA